MFGSKTFLFIHFVEPNVKIIYKTNILKYCYYLNINLKLVTFEITNFFVYFMTSSFFTIYEIFTQSIDLEIIISFLILSGTPIHSPFFKFSKNFVG
jgi:hypothetical protein